MGNSRARPSRFTPVALALLVLGPASALSRPQAEGPKLEFGPEGLQAKPPQLCNEILPAYRRLSRSSSAELWTAHITFAGYSRPKWETVNSTIARQAAVGMNTYLDAKLRDPAQTPSDEALAAGARSFDRDPPVALAVQEADTPTPQGQAHLYRLTANGPTWGTVGHPKFAAGTHEPLSRIVLGRFAGRQWNWPVADGDFEHLDVLTDGHDTYFLYPLSGQVLKLVLIPDTNKPAAVLVCSIHPNRRF